MEDFAVPGTWGSLTLRLLQCIFAGCSITAMTTSADYDYYTAFCFLMISMAQQVVWGFGLLLLDAYLLFQKKDSYNFSWLGLLVYVDWETAAMVLGSVSASAGIMEKVLLDVERCNHENEYCFKYQVSIAFAFFSWITLAISSLFMLWLLARSPL